MIRSSKLKVAIDCRIGDPMQGTGRAVIGLAGALSASSSCEQDYTFVVRQDVSDWIRPHVFGPCRLLTAPAPKTGNQFKSKFRDFPGVRSLYKTIRPYSKRIVPVPVSDGLLESQNFDVVHFPTQTATLTGIPSIFQPWDLQHAHFPQYFPEMEIKARETLYRAFCNRARYVCVQTEWGKSDLVRNLSIEPGKVKVIRWGTDFEAHLPASASSVSVAAAKLQLPDQFLFYPAVTWEHKNHAVIIRALRILKETYGVRAQVRFSGKWTEFRSNLDRLASELGVADQIGYLGFVSPEELQAVYARASAMIFPSKFEGFGLPILEAFHAGLPVLSSTATVLPEVAQDAALYFDPDSPDQLALQVKRVLQDAELRSRLVERGRLVLSRYSTKQMVADFQDLYELTARGSGHECDAALREEQVGR
jgi:glycosyltransferase involved in cell wall biosynthesis